MDSFENSVITMFITIVWRWTKLQGQCYGCNVTCNGIWILKGLAETA